MDRSKVWDQGYEAYFFDKTNPYVRKSSAWKAWKRGFNAAEVACLLDPALKMKGRIEFAH